MELATGECSGYAIHASEYLYSDTDIVLRVERWHVQNAGSSNI
jgi:hypothetical protein